MINSYQQIKHELNFGGSTSQVIDNNISKKNVVFREKYQGYNYFRSQNFAWNE